MVSDGVFLLVAAKADDAADRGFVCWRKGDNDVSETFTGFTFRFLLCDDDDEHDVVVSVLPFLPKSDGVLLNASADLSFAVDTREVLCDSTSNEDSRGSGLSGGSLLIKSSLAVDLSLSDM